MNKKIISVLLFALSICSVCFAISDNEFDGVPQESIGAHEVVQSKITAKQMLEANESTMAFRCDVRGNTRITIYQSGYNYGWSEKDIKLYNHQGHYSITFPSDKNTKGHTFTKSIFIQTDVDNTKIYGTCYYLFHGK